MTRTLIHCPSINWGGRSIDDILKISFTIDQGDVDSIYTKGMEYRRKQRATPQFNPDLDYTVETRIILAHCYHRLKESGVQKRTLKGMEMVMALYDESYKERDRVEERSDQIKDQFKGIMRSPDRDKVKQRVKRTMDYLAEQQRLRLAKGNPQTELFTNGEHIYTHVLLSINSYCELAFLETERRTTDSGKRS